MARDLRYGLVVQSHVTGLSLEHRPALSPSAVPLLLLGVVTLMAGLLRFVGLGRRDFWFDESCTFIYVHQLFDWPANSNLLVESTNLPYYFLLRGWTNVFGESEAAYRSLSAVAGTLTVPLLAWFAWRVRGAWAAIACGILAAVHPLHVYYSREARAYSLWMLVLSLALVLLYEACRRERWRWWVAFGVTLLLALHLHYFTIYWTAASAVGAAVARQPKQALQKWTATVGAASLLFMPYFVAAVLPAAAGGGNKWIATDFDAVMSIPKTLWALLPAGAYPSHLRGLSLDSSDTLVRQPLWLAAGAQIVPPLVVLLAALLFMRGRKEREAIDGPRRLSSFLLGMAMLPLVLAWLYSLLVRPNYLVARYDLVAWPAFILWIGAVLSIAAQSMGKTVVLALLVASSAVPLHRLLAADAKPSLHRLRAERLATLSTDQTLVISFSYDRDYLRYHLHRAGFRGAISSYPSWLETQVGWVDSTTDLARLDIARADAKALAERISQQVLTGGDVYILADSVDPEGAGPRAPLNALLLETLEGLGFEGRVTDAEFLILRVAPM